MKQHITPTQASEVTFEEFKKIYMGTLVERDDWAKFHSGKMTIGRLIQFINSELGYFDIMFGEEGHVKTLASSAEKRVFYNLKGNELVDVLWKIAKQLIGKEV